MYNVQIYLFLIILLGASSFAQELGNITIYNSDNSELSYNTIRCLEFDDSERLWIGTEVGLNVFNESNNSWINIDANLLKSNIATSLEWDTFNENPSMFIGTMNGIKNVWWDNDELESNVEQWTWDHNFGNDCEPNNGVINTILHNDTSDQIWAGSTDGLCVEDLGAEGSWFIQNTENGFYSNNITRIVQNINNNMIGIGTMNGGLVTYQNEFNIYYSSNSDILDNSVLDVVFDQNNNIIICTPQAGLGVLTESGSWIWFNTINSNLPTNSLQNIAIDNNNDLWITTLENGLIHYTNNNFYHYNTTNSGIPDNNINCLKFDPNNDLWLGTETQGLVKINMAETSINQDEVNFVKIWPSIFHNKVNTEINQPSKVYMLNVNGQIVDKYILNTGINSINTTQYNPGFYVIVIESNNNKHIKQETFDNHRLCPPYTDTMYNIIKIKLHVFIFP